MQPQIVNFLPVCNTFRRYTLQMTTCMVMLENDSVSKTSRNNTGWSIQQSQGNLRWIICMHIRILNVQSMNNWKSCSQHRNTMAASYWHHASIMHLVHRCWNNFINVSHSRYFNFCIWSHLLQSFDVLYITPNTAHRWTHVPMVWLSYTSTHDTAHMHAMSTFHHDCRYVIICWEWIHYKQTFWRRKNN